MRQRPAIPFSLLSNYCPKKRNWICQSLNWQVRLEICIRKSLIRVTIIEWTLMSFMRDHSHPHACCVQLHCPFGNQINLPSFLRCFLSLSSATYTPSLSGIVPPALLGYMLRTVPSWIQDTCATSYSQSPCGEETAAACASTLVRVKD